VNRFIIVLMLLLAPVTAFAQSPVTVRTDATAPGAQIPDDFTGLSFEMQTLLPGKDGEYIFSPDNKKLIALFKQLGLKNIRVGGNTADKPTVPVPGEKDIDSLFGFADAVDAKVIYTLRLRETADPTDAARIAKYIEDHYKPRLACFAIGNEPNVYSKTYEPYRDAIQKYIDAITAPAVAPDAIFCGPSATPGKAAWARTFADDFGPGGKVKLITQHAYPGGSAKKVTDAATARDQMLSSDWHKNYQKMYDAFVPAAKTHKLPYRLEEANSFFNGGAQDVSDTLASSLWGLDFLWWWASHDAAGVNFHTGDKVAANNDMLVCRYATYFSTPNGYDVHPIGYAIKAFNLGGHGRIVPVEIGDSKLNLTAYAVIAKDQRLIVTLINKEHGERAEPAKLKLSAGPYTRAEAIYLEGSKGPDVSITTGVTLGGAPIEQDASWNGQWKKLDGTSVEVPPATAVIVKLSTN
jgi:hypothetical protein